MTATPITKVGDRTTPSQATACPSAEGVGEPCTWPSRQDRGLLLTGEANRVQRSGHNPNSLFRYNELADPPHSLGDGCRGAVEPLIGGPVFATEDIREGEVVRVIDRPLAELTCDPHRPRVNVGSIVDFYS